MSLNTLTSQLRRDMAANPKKAAALGLMVLVALYFWGPLVWRFMKSGSGNQNPKANMAALILTDDPVEPSQQGRATTRTRFRWEKVRQLMQQDPHMQSAAFDVAWSEPFGKSAPATAALEPTAEATTDDQAAATALAALDPSSLGVVLGGIMIGQRNKFATINGKTCREGQLISLGDKRNKSVTYELRVLKIGRQSVQLEVAGRIFTLELAQSTLAHGDEFERGRPKERD